VAVVGGGAAGLYVAIRAAREGAEVALISRKPLAESSSFWAQGGLAAALAPDDSPTRHADDTLIAGRGLCRSDAVETLVAGFEAAAARDCTGSRADWMREAMEAGHVHEGVLNASSGWCSCCTRRTEAYCRSIIRSTPSI